MVSRRALLLLVAATGCRASVAPPPDGTAAPVACDRVSAPFVGTLCAPARAGVRRPAVVLLGGWPGGDQMRAEARDLAAHGFVAASVAYFAAPGTQPLLVEVPVETAGRAIEALAERPDVDPNRIGVMGTSKGGEYALLVSSAYPEVKAVVANVPSPFAWFGLGEGGTPTDCSWSRHGKAVPCVMQDHDAGMEIWRAIQARRPLVLRPSYERSREGAEPAVLRAAFFPLELIAGPVLCLAGDDDQVWDGRTHCQMAMQYLQDRKHPYPDRMVSYPGAGHLFIVARGGPSTAVGAVPLKDRKIELGGAPEADARAAAAAWAEIYAFLHAALGA